MIEICGGFGDGERGGGVAVDVKDVRLAGVRRAYEIGCEGKEVSKSEGE